VVTGDNGLTAAAIARRIGIGSGAGGMRVVNGAELDTMSERDLDELLGSGTEVVFARSSPEAKLRIADALRAKGQVVAMTGDGVNDALAGGAVPLPLTVMEILAIDLGTDTLPALALSREPAEPGLMDRPPRPRRQGVISAGMLARAWGFLGVISAGRDRGRAGLRRRGGLPARPARPVRHGGAFTRPARHRGALPRHRLGRRRDPAGAGPPAGRRTAASPRGAGSFVIGQVAVSL